MLPGASGTTRRSICTLSRAGRAGLLVVVLAGGAGPAPAKPCSCTSYLPLRVQNVQRLQWLVA